MVSTLKALAIAILVGAAICVPIVFFAHHALMPGATELAEIDSAVQKAAPPGAKIRRLSAPDRIEMIRDLKSGYFTYDITENGRVAKYQADWQISGTQVKLISLRHL
jgi:hypothetical protein